MRNKKRGEKNGFTTWCPVNAYGDCPYCDQQGICHTDDPFEDCDDWCSVFDYDEGWEGWYREVYGE